MKLRKFSLLDGRLEEDVVQWNDAVIEQSLLRGMMVNVTSQRMLNALGYKRLHKLSAISGCKRLQSQVELGSKRGVASRLQPTVEHLTWKTTIRLTYQY